MECLSERCEANLKKCNGDETIDDIDPAIQKSLNKIIAKEGYLSHKIYRKSLTTKGGNYLGILGEVTIKGKTAEGYKETHLFIKEQVTDSNLSGFIQMSEIYSNEAYFYEELSKIFIQAQDEVALPLHDRYRTVKSYDENCAHALILEDLSKRGFETLNRIDIMPIKFAELAIIELAKFHGLSFVIQTKRPNYFERKIKSMRTPMTYSDAWYSFVRSTVDKTTILQDRETRNKMINYIPTLLERFPRHMVGDFATVKCLCHGDYRLNNILAKKVDDEITEVMPVDYQLLQYGSPFIDFMYFIFGGTDTQFRKEHLEDLKDLYYETMKKFLSHFALNIDEFCTRKQFEQEYNDHLELGLMFSLLFLPWFLILEDNAPDLSKDEIINIDFKLHHTFKERTADVIQEFSDWGYI